MPKLDGEATFYALRAVDPEVRILLTSGFAREESCKRLLSDGALGMVLKPYRNEDLLAKIQASLPCTQEDH